MTLKEMMYVADNFDSGCCGEYISVQIFDGNVAALTCGGDGEIYPENHKLDGNTFTPKITADNPV